MLYTQSETENLRRRRNHLLWALASMVVVTTITSFFLFGAMFNGSSKNDIEQIFLNPIMLINIGWIGLAVFRVTSGINPRMYFCLPMMLLCLIFPYVVIPFLLIKASSIIKRPPIPDFENK